MAPPVEPDVLPEPAGVAPEAFGAVVPEPLLPLSALLLPLDVVEPVEPAPMEPDVPVPAVPEPLVPVEPLPLVAAPETPAGPPTPLSGGDGVLALVPAPVVPETLELLESGDVDVEGDVEGDVELEVSLLLAPVEEPLVVPAESAPLSPHAASSSPSALAARIVLELFNKESIDVPFH